MILGIFFAITSGLLWGLIFIGPLLIPEYPSILQTTGRYVAFGLISIPLSWYNRQQLSLLSLNDWLEALKLVLAGHLIYYTCLTSAIQRVGAPITTAIIGTLPLVVTISTHLIPNYKKEITQKISTYSILMSLCLISIGLLCINISELTSTLIISNTKEYFTGIILAITSVLCWTWYALRNARWLKKHPQKNPMTWSNAQGITTLPLSCLMYIIYYIYLHYIHQNEFILPLGPRPIFFICLMIIIGFSCSWLGTFFWNAASQRLPTTLIGPLIVFETIAGLIYSFLHRQSWPSSLIFVGIFLLISGVIYPISTHSNIKYFSLKNNKKR